MNEVAVQAMLQELEEHRNIMGTRAVRMRAEVAGLQADLKKTQDELEAVRKQLVAATAEAADAA